MISTSDVWEHTQWLTDKRSILDRLHVMQTPNHWATLCPAITSDAAQWQTCDWTVTCRSCPPPEIPCWAGRGHRGTPDCWSWRSVAGTRPGSTWLRSQSPRWVGRSRCTEPLRCSSTWSATCTSSDPWSGSFRDCLKHLLSCQRDQWVIL